jgi:cell fate (sporulation/competence/biofilm development) regulator YmcA (YheA/YmcA/DUF963 family)
MTIDLTHVLVFRTNIGTEIEKQKVKQLLESHPLVEESSVDMEDVDRVLRVVSKHLHPEEIINLIKNGGFECHELE